MPLVNFFDHDGNQYEVNVEAGTTIMQAAIDNGIDGIAAECGGACSCATCHCYIDENWTEKTGEPSDIEKQMLEQFEGEIVGVRDATEHQAGEHSYY